MSPDAGQDLLGFEWLQDVIDRPLAQADEPLFMLEEYYFDMPFYARLRAPVAIVDDWAGPDVQLRDNWRKELSDAGRFAPASASTTLLSPADLAQSLCRFPVSWVVGEAASVDIPSFLQDAQVVESKRGTILWRVVKAAPGVSQSLGCADAPRDDSPDK